MESIWQTSSCLLEPAQQRPLYLLKQIQENQLPSLSYTWIAWEDNLLFFVDSIKLCVQVLETCTLRYEQANGKKKKSLFSTYL